MSSRPAATRKIILLVVAVVVTITCAGTSVVADLKFLGHFTNLGQCHGFHVLLEQPRLSSRRGVELSGTYVSYDHRLFRLRGYY
jgi:hypothetical protein